MAGGRGLKGHDRTPRQDTRARRNAQRFAGDASYLFSGALAVNDEGLIVLNLQTNGGLSQDLTGLTVVVTAPIALDAGGVHLDYGVGLTLDAGDLVVDDTVFVPYTGATADLDLGAHNFTTTGMVTGLLQMGQNLAPAYTTVQHWSDLTQSACVVEGGVISDSGGGEVDVSAARGIIKTAATEISPNVFFNYVGELNFALDDNKLNYLYLAYVDTDNAPTLQKTDDRTTINDQTEILIGWVYRVGAALHIINVGHRFQNHNARNRIRVRDVRGFERATGMVVSTDATRHVLSTEGIMYRYIDKLTVAAFDSTVGGGNVFTYWYRDGGGGWTPIIDQTIINNANYDDGVPPLGVLGANRYGVHWVYVASDSHVHIVYGRGNYRMAEAEDATPPSDIPDLVENEAILAGKIIVKVGTNTTTVASAFDIKFSATGVDEHNDLGAIQGGAADDYFHLTTANRTAVLATTVTVNAGAANWDTAFGWGDHAGLYETVGAVAAHLVAYDHDTFVTAVGWGDHAGLYEPIDATLTSIALLGTAADKMIYTTNVDVWAETPITAAGRAILDDATAADQANTLGLGVADAVTHGSITVGGATIGALSGVLLGAAGIVAGGAALNNLSDVNAGAPADNDSLTYDLASGKWIPEAVGAGAGIGMERVWMGC